MTPRPEFFLAFAVTLIFVIVLVARPDLTRQRAGRILAFIALFLMPGLTIWMGFTEHWERSKTTAFCLSCHVMREHGRSLYVDDEEFLPAVHFQNHYVPEDHACYTCHTTYSLYGGLSSKVNGMRHVWVYYTNSEPDTLKLYRPYNNRECLHCHLGARKFESADAHNDTDTTRAALINGKVSCLTSGCHDVAHNVGSLASQQFWKGPKP